MSFKAIEGIEWDNDSQGEDGLLTWSGKPFTVQIDGFTTQVLVDNGATTTKQPFSCFTKKHGFKLERTYKAVVDFIKWYNQNNQ